MAGVSCVRMVPCCGCLVCTDSFPLACLSFSLSTEPSRPSGGEPHMLHLLQMFQYSICMLPTSCKCTLSISATDLMCRMCDVHTLSSNMTGMLYMCVYWHACMSCSFYLPWSHLVLGQCPLHPDSSISPWSPLPTSSLQLVHSIMLGPGHSTWEEEMWWTAIAWASL